MAPNSLTSILPVKQECIADLRRVLIQVANPLKDKNPFVRFGEETHFARLVLIPGKNEPVIYPGDDGECNSWRLLFCGIFDGDAANFVRNFAQLSPDLDSIFRCLEGWDTQLTIHHNPNALVDYLTRRDHIQRPGIFYSTFPDQNVAMVKWQNELLEKIETLLSAPDGLEKLRGIIASAPNREATIQTILGRDITLPTRLNTGWNRSIAVLMLAAVVILYGFFILALPADARLWVILGTVILLILIGLFAISPLFARRITRFGAIEDQIVESRTTQVNRLDYGEVEGTGREDVIAQNQFNLYLTFKGGRWRLWQMQLLMTVLQPFTRYLGVSGVLGGLTTVHFGHWVVIDGGKRLFFMTCYDGSWENYIADFVNKIADVLDVQLLNFEGFSNEGTRSMAAFRRWLRRVQIQSEVFYSAYPLSTVRNIMSVRQLVDTCPSKGSSEAEIQSWLASL